MKKEKSATPTPQELQKENDSLRRQVDELTQNLKTANDEIQSVIYSISHDLRAPLRAIDGYSRILEQDYEALLDDNGKRLIEIIRSSTKTMDNLMTDLLSLSRVGSAEMKLEQIDMTALVKSVLNELVPQEIMGKISITLTELPTGYGDVTLLHRVWSNLISNAIKFSLPKSQPKVVISGDESSAETMYRINDNGVGFSPENKVHLFGLFQRFQKADEFSGSGVGLAIVKRVVLRHSGQVWADGQPGVGAEFGFSLPKPQKS